MSSLLDDIRSLGLEVTWGTLLVGLEGPGKFSSTVALAEAQAFAAEQVAASIRPADEAIVVVATSMEKEETSRSLRQLARINETDLTNELRKWRLVLLRQVLEKVPQ
jgi:hypothetical protein